MFKVLSVIHKAVRPARVMAFLACILLAACLVSAPVKQTTAFITAESATCVNTFSGEAIAPVPDPEPGDGKPTTGDTSNPGAWLVLAGISAGLCGISFAVLKFRKVKN